MEVFFYGFAAVLAVFAANCFVMAFKVLFGSHSAYELNRNASGNVRQAITGHTRLDEVDGISRVKHGVAFERDKGTGKFKVKHQSALCDT